MGSRRAVGLTQRKRGTSADQEDARAATRRQGSMPREAQGGQFLLLCPPDGRTPEGGQEGRLGLTALNADKS